MKEAKATVMDTAEMEEIYNNGLKGKPYAYYPGEVYSRKAQYRDIAKAQAEITAPLFFKAGRESFLDDVGNATISLREVYEKGRREVVDFMKSREVATDLLGAVRFYASRDEWNAKLKEWGIDDGSKRHSDE